MKVFSKYAMIVVTFLGLAYFIGLGGFLLGQNNPVYTPPVSLESIRGLHMTLDAPITLTANLERGEWECSNDYGTIKTITAYTAERNNMDIVSERSSSGGMITLNPTDTMKTCHGYTN